MIPRDESERGIRVAALLVGAAAVGLASTRGRGRDLDERAFRALNAGWGPPSDAFFAGITELGSIWASAGATAALVAVGERRVAARAIAAASSAWVAGQVLKRVFLRTRPYIADEEGTRVRTGRPRGTSWPSSHPAVLFAFTTVAERELGLGFRDRAWLTALAGAVGLSRIYLGVHYPGDVVGGLLMGRAVADAWSSS